MNGAESGERCFLALGSNLGDRRALLAEARRRIAALDGVTVTAASRVYETEPWGYAEQDDFLNCVLECRSTRPAPDLRAACAVVELEMGRLPAPRNHPRSIDIDLLLYGSLALRTEGLTVPHPGLARRRFVLVPLCELAPDLRHPVLGQTMRELLAVCPDMGRLRMTGMEWT